MAKQTARLSLKYRKMLMQWVISTITEEDSVETAQTTEAIEETTTEAITEVAKITKGQLKTPRTTNLPTEEETTHKEEADKTEEVEVAITLKEEAVLHLLSTYLLLPSPLINIFAASFSSF